MTPEELAAIRAREQQATPGPWRTDPHPSHFTVKGPHAQ